MKTESRLSRLSRLYELSARLDAILFGRDDEESGGDLQQKVGMLAGGAGGVAAGLALPGIARRQAGIDQGHRNAMAQRIKTARTQDRAAAAAGISNERIAGAGLKTTGKLGVAGRLGNTSRRWNKRLAGGGAGMRGAAALGLGLAGAAGGYAVGKMFNPDTYA